VSPGGSKRCTGVDTGSTPRADRTEVDRLLHELRSTLARLKAELELLALDDGTVQFAEVRTSLEQVLRLITKLEIATLALPSGESQGLVIIDDDGRLGAAMARQMIRLGFAATAQQSLEGLASLPPKGTTIVIDLGVLRTCEPDDLEIVRGLRPIVVTGSADPLARLEASSYGAVAFLQKPVSPEALAMAMSNARDKLDSVG